MGSFTSPPFLHDLVHYLAPVNNFVYDHLETDTMSYYIVIKLWHDFDNVFP